MTHVVTIIRGSATFGPYDEVRALAYFKNGNILLNDLTRIDGRPEIQTFEQAAAFCGWKLPSPQNPLKVIQRIGLDFLFPFLTAHEETWKKIRSQSLIAFVGLAPLIVLTLRSTLAIYLMLGLYFSVLWGLFFWTRFRTETSSFKYGALCFCVTAFLSTTALLVLHSFGVLKIFEPMLACDSLLLRFVGYFFRAGMPEEICKAAVIFWLIRRPGLILKPQDVVLYGLLSGFGFGIHEGLSYQLGVNRELNSVDAAYALNILRLTSLPFLHACWCGIASYFLAYGVISPMNRYGLWLLAILIPATIHAGYDACGLSVLGLLFATVGVVLMLVYLEGARLLRRKLL